MVFTMSTEKIKKNMAIKIKVARTEKNMSQKKLADNVGVSQMSVSRWESGNLNMSFHTLIKLCDVLEKDWNYFNPEKNVSVEAN